MNKQEALQFLSELESGIAKIIDANENYKLNVENKQKILDVFKALDIEELSSNIFTYRDKIPVRKKISNFRVVPGAIIRAGVCIGDDVVIMPSFVNIGAHVGSKTMIDSGVTIGSCAYIGKRCHIASNAVIAGVLEPIGNMPVVIEDDVFIGAHCLIAEGMRVMQGAVVASKVHLTSSTKIIDRATGKEFDHVPPFSVVVPGFYKSVGNAFIECAWIVKVVDQQSRSKTSINEILRIAD